MEAVVAVALSVRLFVPERKTVGKRLTLFRTGEVDHRRRTAEDRCARTACKIICRGRSGNVQIEMRMRVDKAGKQVAALHINDTGVFAVFQHDVTDLDDPFAVEQHVGAAAGTAADNEAAAKDGPHIHHLAL